MNPQYNKKNIFSSSSDSHKSFKNKNENNGQKQQLSFSDLGLKTAVPPALLKTTKQKKEEIFLKKKEHQQRTKLAFEQLELQKAHVERQREFLKQETEEYHRERELHRKQLKIQQITAQNQRKHEAKEIDKKVLQKQQEIITAKLQHDAELEKKIKETQKMIQEDVKRQIKQQGPAVNIIVKRTDDISRQRASLPILAEEQAIMESIFENSVAVITAETGSGKTTQVPQFLWEAGFGHQEGKPYGRQGMIAVTEPRRVAAVSMAKRVAEELNEPFGGTVCYHVRYDNNISEDCRLKFMTEGILLKEIQSDFLLNKYSVIVCDEAHERAVSCDVLLGLLSRIVQLRNQLYEEQKRRIAAQKIEKESNNNNNKSNKEKQNSECTCHCVDSLKNTGKVTSSSSSFFSSYCSFHNLLKAPHEEEEENGKQKQPSLTPLKLVIMSATLRVSDFLENKILFPQRTPPLVHVGSRHFPVTNHFARITELFSYVQEAFKKVRQIHKKLPPGGILIFLSTQKEIEMLCGLLEEFYAKTRVFYQTHRYGKHAMLRKRKGNGVGGGEVGRIVKTAIKTTAKIINDKETTFLKLEKEGREQAQQEEENLDEYGLTTDEYGLDGDEDGPFPWDENDNNKGKEDACITRLVDDYDYGKQGEELDAEEPDDDMANDPVARVNLALERAKEHVMKVKFDRRRQVSLTKSDNNDENNPYDENKNNNNENDSDAPPISIRYKSKNPHENGQGDDEPDGDLNTLHILPFYALLDPAQQQLVFHDPPHGKRLCVISTNVAETSITIPNIRYVVDTGRVKTKVLEEGTGACSYRIEWTSQASAEQRAGRAGRIAPGHCYRLYSTAVFANRMQQHSTPEILRTPLESVVLMMKHLNIEQVARFPFPTPPPRELIRRALRHLVMLGALHSDVRAENINNNNNIININNPLAIKQQKHKQPSQKITPLGEFLMKFPVPPRYAKMIFEVLRVASEDFKLQAYVTTIVAMISTTMDNFRLGGARGEGAGAALSPQQENDGISLGNSPGKDQENQKNSKNKEKDDFFFARQMANQKGLLHAGSDLITALRCFGVFVGNPSLYNCRLYNLIHKTMSEAYQLRKQLDVIVREVVNEDKDDEGINDDDNNNNNSECGDDKGLNTTNEVTKMKKTALNDKDLAELQDSMDMIEGNGSTALPKKNSSVDASQDLFSTSPFKKRKEEKDQHLSFSLVQLRQRKRQQLNILLTERYHFNPRGEVFLLPPNEVLLRKIIITGLWDQVARRASVTECTSQGFCFYEGGSIIKVPYFDVKTSKVVFVHPSSSVARTRPAPEWLTYCVLTKTKRKMSNPDDEGVFLPAIDAVGKVQRMGEVRAMERLYMKGVTIVSKLWLDQLKWKEDAVKDSVMLIGEEG